MLQPNECNARTTILVFYAPATLLIPPFKIRTKFLRTRLNNYTLLRRFKADVIIVRQPRRVFPDQHLRRPMLHLECWKFIYKSEEPTRDSLNLNQTLFLFPDL